MPYYANNLFVKPAGRKGLGVFAHRNIRAGELVESCPLVELHGGLDTVKAVGLGNRYFEQDGQHYISLGYGGLYNHSETPNLDWRHDHRTLTFVTQRFIFAGEELVIRYADSVPFEVFK